LERLWETWGFGLCFLLLCQRNPGIYRLSPPGIKWHFNFGVFKKERILFWFFFDFFLSFLIFFDLNLSGERVAAELLAHLEEALEVAPKGLGVGLCRGAGGSERVATQVVVGHPEALEGVSGGSGGSGRRHDD
jgi:hypothetical protein